MCVAPLVDDVGPDVDAGVVGQTIAKLPEVPVAQPRGVGQSRRHRDQEEEVLSPGWGHVGVGHAGGAHVEQGAFRPAVGVVDGLGVGTEGGVEVQVVVQQPGDAPVQAHVEEEGAGGQGPLVPVGLVVAAPALGEQLLLDVVVVPRADDDRGVPLDPISRGDTGDAPLRHGDGGHLLPIAEPDAVALGHPHHGPDDFVHPAHRVPGPQGRVGVVHQAVEGGGFFGFGPQEKNRKLDDLQQLRVLKVLARVRAEGGEQGQLHGVAQGLPTGEFPNGVGRLPDEGAHADVVLCPRFCQEGPQPESSARLQGLEQGLQRLHVGGDVHRAILEHHPVRRAQPNQVQLRRDFGPKPGKVPLKHVRHPVPTGPHVEEEALRSEGPCPAAGLVMAFEYVHRESVGRQRGRSSDAGKTCADDQRVGGRVGSKGRGHGQCAMGSVQGTRSDAFGSKAPPALR